MYFGDQRPVIVTAMLLQEYLPGRHAEIHRKRWVHRYDITPSSTSHASALPLQVLGASLVSKETTVVDYLKGDTSAVLRSAIRRYVCRRCTDEHGQSFTGCPMVLLLLPVGSLPTIGVRQEEPRRVAKDDARFLVQASTGTRRMFFSDLVPVRPMFTEVCGRGRWS